MCGIFGLIDFNQPIDRKLFKTATDSLSHRGLDDSGYYFDKNNPIALGHRRLSILDTSPLGHQPMFDKSGRYGVIFNGEIYNYPDLKKRLQNQYNFKGNSDTEILIAGFIHWGIDYLVNIINGIYAFSIIDLEKHEVFLVRDLNGIKPLYFLQKNGQLMWGSEIKSLKAYENQLTIDNTAVYDFLTYGYIPRPKSYYKEIKQVEPASYMHWSFNDLENPKSVKYYSFTPFEIQKSISNEDAQFEFKRLISKSVEEQLISDVPVGFFLSGGIDSSIITYEASKFRQPLDTYSIGFDVSEYSETVFARIIAEQIKSNHHEKIVSEKDALDLINLFPTWFDEPFSDTSAMPTYIVSQFAKQNSTVVLTGDGGDELFGGYNWYQHFYSDFKQPLPYNSFKKWAISHKKDANFIGKIARRLYPFFRNEYEFYVELMNGLIHSELDEYNSILAIPKDYDPYWYIKQFDEPDLPIRTRFQWIDFNTYLIDDILKKVDRTSMANSLEARVPFLTKSIINFAFSLPENVRFQNNMLKGILREAYADVFPDEITKRGKRGFSIPQHKWGNLFDSKQKRPKLIFDRFYRD
ncbi:MAG: asparagine synthase (glutamine-hydrolyzing) [Bacteroidetes bacterium]|nr:asparagine synthase (glutamine-hydrolyzing) [Bacteroidota bacterium]